MKKEELIKLLKSNNIDGRIVNQVFVEQHIEFCEYDEEKIYELFGVDPEQEDQDYLSYDELTSKFESALEKSEIPKFELKDREGGSDQGSHYHIVIYFPTLDIYLMSVGSYSSYEGANYFGEWISVSPQEQTIIVYKPN